MASFPTSILRQVVVIEVIDDGERYSLLSDEEFKELFESPQEKEVGKKRGIFSVFNGSRPGVANILKKQIKCSPRNSIVGLDVTPNDNDGVIPRLYYPFFQSHFSLPLKPGETVWVISPGANMDTGAPSSIVDTSLSASGKSKDDLDSFTPSEAMCEGYWMSRICLPRYAEDLNFSHADRSKSILNISEQISKKSGPEIKAPRFDNGIGTDEKENPKLGKTLKTDLTYDDINSLAQGSALSTREVVPRFTSRPGDLVLQGSNNTLICLGEDRPTSSITKAGSVNYPVEEGQPESKEQKPVQKLPRLKEYQGSIDIVAGRSAQAILNPALEVNLRPKETPSITDINARKYEEVEKRPWVLTDKDKRLGAKKDGIPSQNVLEGDPNFISDLSRLYVSMKTNGDKNLGYSDPNSLPRLGNDPTFNPVDSAPYIITKSKEVRMIASHSRESDGSFVEDVTNAGSIRIIKEGRVDAEGHPESQASIFMNPDGTMLIDSPSIVIGSGKEAGNGEGTQVYIGNNAEEPLVLGNELKSRLDEIIAVIEKILTKLSTHTHPTGVGPSGPPLPPEAIDFSATIKSADITPIKNKLDQIKSKIAKTK